MATGGDVRKGGCPKTEGSGATTQAQCRAQMRGPDGLGLELLCRATHAAQAPLHVPQPPRCTPAPHQPRCLPPPTPPRALCRTGHRTRALARWARITGELGSVAPAPSPPSQGSAAAAGPGLSAEGTAGTLLGRGFHSLTRGTAQAVASASGQIPKCPESFWPPSVAARAGAQPGGGGRALPPGIRTPQWLIIPR